MANLGVSVFGPMLIGVFLNCILYGTMVVQTLMYFQTYRKDPRWFKMFVFYLLICETLNTGCDIALMYEPLVIRNGALRAFIVAPIMLWADPALTVMISLPVQVFIAWRIKIVSRKQFIPAIIVIFAIVSFGGGIATTIAIAVVKEFAQFRRFYAAAITWLACSAVADIIITVSLVYNLSMQRTGIAATDHLINKIIRMTVQTGLITAVSALLDILFFLKIKDANTNFICDLALSKLYSNSLLSTLNARGGWKTTSSTRDNVLFGALTTTEGENMAKSRTQIEILAVDGTGRPSSMVPMKVFGVGPGCHDEPAISDAQKFEYINGTGSSGERFNY